MDALLYMREHMTLERVGQAYLRDQGPSRKKAYVCERVLRVRFGV